MTRDSLSKFQRPGTARDIMLSGADSGNKQSVRARNANIDYSGILQPTNPNDLEKVRAVEAVADALEPMCAAFGKGNMPRAVAQELAEAAIQAMPTTAKDERIAELEAEIANLHIELCR